MTKTAGKYDRRIQLIIIGMSTSLLNSNCAMELYTRHYLSRLNLYDQMDIQCHNWRTNAPIQLDPQGIHWDCHKGAYYENDGYGNTVEYERLSPKNFENYEDYLQAFEYYRNPQSTRSHTPPIVAPTAPIYDVNRPREGPPHRAVPRGRIYDRNLIDTAIIGDSIIRKVKKIGHCHVICYPGLHVEGLTKLIEANQCPELAGKNMIVVHVGTNSLDIPYQQLLNDFDNLFGILMHTYPRANLFWNAILPRADVDEAKAYKIIMINNEMRSNRQLETISSVNKFHRNRVPRPELYKADKLHLNSFGVLILRNTLRHNLLRWRSSMGIHTLSALEAPYEHTSIVGNWRALI